MRSSGISIRVVLVEPKYQINLGYAARVAKNFGIRRLYLVNPKCRYSGKNAIKYSKHARDLLEGAKVCRDIRSAVNGAALVVGTTGIPSKASGGMFNLYSSRQLHKMLREAKSMALLIGRDGTGLTKEELSDCDAVVTIPTSSDYPIMNISHALAVLLYELYSYQNKEGKTDAEKISRELERKRLAKLFSYRVNRIGSVKDKSGVIRAFTHVINRANPSKKELRALEAAFSLNWKE